MRTKRTFTNELKTIYRWSLTVVAVFGFMQLPNIPFNFIGEKGNTSFNIITSGNFGSPIEMAENVTIPLENALGGLPVSTKISSETTSTESSIRVTLKEQPAKVIYQHLMQLIRETSERITSEAGFPRLERNMTTAKGLEVFIWLNTSENTVRSHMSELLDSIRNVPGTNRIKVALSGYKKAPSVSRIKGNSTMHFALQQAEQITADEQAWLFFRNHIFAKENLSTRKYIRIPDDLLTINGFEGIRLEIIPDAEINTLWWRWNILRKFNQLNDIPFFHSFVLSDPYAWVVASLASQCSIIGILLILLCLLRRFQPFDLFGPLIFPGLYIFIYWLGEWPFDPAVIEILGFLWMCIIIIHFIPDFRIGGHTIYYLLGTVALCCFLAYQSVLITNPQQFVSLVPGLFTICLVLFERIVPLPTIPFFNYRPPILASGIIVLFIVLQATNYTGVTSIRLFEKPLNNSTNLPGDNLQTSRHLILRAHKTSFAPEPGPESGKMLVKLIENYHPDILICEIDEFKQRTLHAFWKKLSEKQSLQLRSAIIPHLLNQNGTRWTLDGLGELFQNDRVFIPGTYQIEFSGPDYSELLARVTKTADSIGSLPGTGSISVNEDLFSVSPYYSLEVNTDIEDNQTDIFQYLRMVGDPQDTMSLMHTNYFTEDRTVSLTGKSRLRLTMSPAPVKRINNRFIIPLRYAHYAGEKYALEFYYKLHARIRMHLTSGMALLPISLTTTPAKTYNGLILFALGMIVLVLTKSNYTALFFTDLLTIWGAIIIFFCYFHGYSIAAFMLQRVMLLTICLLILIDMKKAWIMTCLCILSLYQMYVYLFVEIGRLRVESELTLYLTASAALYCLIAGGTTVNHRKEQSFSTTA